jgi:hypothetical protein
MKLMRVLLDRLDEKSTWLAIGAAVAAFGLRVEPGLWEGISLAGMGLATVLLALWPTKKSEDRVADAVDRRLPQRLRRGDEELPGEAEADPARRVHDSKGIDDYLGDFGH